MKLPNFAVISRFLIITAIFLWIINQYQFKSDLLEWISLFLAILSIVLIIVFAILIKQGKYEQSFKLVVETNVDKALKDGVITQEQAESIPKRIVLNTNDLLLNIIFNFAISNHFDMFPIEVLHESLPQVPLPYLKNLYDKSREIGDDLNDYFRSQKFANKADVITRSDEIKEYLARTYPWMSPDTLENTYNYFFLGIDNL